VADFVKGGQFLYFAHKPFLVFGHGFLKAPVPGEPDIKWVKEQKGKACQFEHKPTFSSITSQKDKEPDPGLPNVQTCDEGDGGGSRT
jgi:hypothetical protein